jgi:hypothetical protein
MEYMQHTAAATMVRKMVFPAKKVQTQYLGYHAVPKYTG